MAWNRRWTLLCWVAAALLGTWVLTSERRAALRASFDLDARVLHRLLSQRMEQQETVLYALAALPTQGMQPDQLTAYVRALVRPYPQIVAVEFCAEVCRALVATQARPDLPYAPTRRPVVGWPAQQGPTYALTLERVRVWINLDRLVQGGDLARLPLTVQIYRPGDRQRLLFLPADGSTPIETVKRDFAVTASVIENLRVVHPMLAVLTSAFLVWLGVFLRRERPGAEVQRWSAALWGVLAAQMVAGFANVTLKAPGWMQLVHLLLALGLWLVLVMLVYRALTGLTVQGAPRARVKGNV